MFSRLPDFPKVYCVFESAEDEYNFDYNYLDIHRFCYKDISNPSSDIIKN